VKLGENFHAGRDTETPGIGKRIAFVAPGTQHVRRGFAGAILISVRDLSPPSAIDFRSRFTSVGSMARTAKMRPGSLYRQSFPGCANGWVYSVYRWVLSTAPLAENIFDALIRIAFFPRPLRSGKACCPQHR